jgi:hypothetical protein
MITGKGRTGSSASVTSALIALLASNHGTIGTRTSIGAIFISGSKSGMYAKSMVEESLTAFMLLLVLKCLTGLPVSVVSGTGIVAEAGRRGALERPVGLSEVSSEEKVAGPVMERGRVVVLELDVRALRARAETRAVDMVADVAMRCDAIERKVEVWGWKRSNKLVSDGVTIDKVLEPSNLSRGMRELIRSDQRGMEVGIRRCGA